MISKAKQAGYDLRFQSFLQEVTKVSQMEPKEEYLYKIMDNVPFKDLEAAILMAKLDYSASMNDNNKKSFK